ncbi:hypothetical protein GDO78_022654 [Eleutherodactylus coqui]|nr:hypothetical protein GDO78_022654 [Eleutherodactylus coqui]
MTEPAGVDDPRSPTQGIVRTPLRPSLHTSLNLLVKQLSDVFVTEDSGIADGSDPNKEAPVETPEEQTASDAVIAPAEEEEKEVEFAEEALTSLAEPTPPSVQPQRPRCKSPRAAGAKNIRQRPRKALVSSAHGRSPLKILQEDNSPNTAMQNRQVKIPFQSEQPASLRNMKMSHCSWEISQNKENAQYTQSDG